MQSKKGASGSRGPTASSATASQFRICEVFSTLAPVQVYPEATELFQQGSPAEDVYLVEQGLVKLVFLNESGHEIILGLRYPGSILGAPSVIMREAYTSTAATLMRSHVRRIPGNVFLRLAMTDPAFSYQVTRALSRVIMEQVTHVSQLAAFSSRQRVETMLRRFILSVDSSQSRDEVRLQLPLKHREIAQLMAITPEHLSRLLRQMQREGVIRREKGWVIVSNPVRILASNDGLA